jgi:hypothetical protein
MTNDNGTTLFTESPASWNTRFITPDGFTCQLTLRSDTGKDLLERANSALAYLREQGCIPFYGYSRDNTNYESKNQDNATENHSNDDSTFCLIHQCQMQRRQKGDKVWYSHKTDSGWCSGIAKNGSKE